MVSCCRGRRRREEWDKSRVESIHKLATADCRVVGRGGDDDGRLLSAACVEAQVDWRKVQTWSGDWAPAAGSYGGVYLELPPEVLQKKHGACRPN